MRIAFPLIGGSSWAGGRNYLLNLLSALQELPGRPVEPVLFAPITTPDEELGPLRPLAPGGLSLSSAWNARSLRHRARFVQSVVFQRDRGAEGLFRSQGIDLVFQHSAWYGSHFRFPTLAWIADFQHRRLRGMFSLPNWLRREIGYRAISRAATTILVSSADARQDCEQYYPQSRGRVAVLPFAVRLDEGTFDSDVRRCRDKYELPSDYIYLPNQFWRHKNHLAVVSALGILAGCGPRIVVAMSGALVDKRHPGHPRRVVAAIEEHNLRESCRVLGVIPHSDVLTLMRGSRAVINPSLSEGWSTTVEEAKALGLPLLLSDIPVHREQAADRSLFFNPSSPPAIVDALRQAWRQWPAQGETVPVRDLLARNSSRRREFAQAFYEIALETQGRFLRSGPGHDIRVDTGTGR